jgi:hypothetical protein
MYSPAWHHYLASAILPRRSTSVFPIYFRFLIFYWYLLPLPHLLLVFTSVSSSFICIGLSFSCIGLYLVVSVYLLVVSVYDIDVFAHNINL